MIFVPPKNLVQAVNEAMMTEMGLDDSVVVMGEDVGVDGGVFRATLGLLEEYGEARVIDTPLAESGILGTAIGMAAYGLKPVAEMQFSGFMTPSFDQFISHASRIRWRSRGRFSASLVVRAPYGGGIHALEHHSESQESIYIHTPGLKTVIPSSPHDAKGLLINAIRDPDPVVFLEPKKIYRAFREEVPEGEYTVPLSECNVSREGSDLTLVSWGYVHRLCLEAAEEAEEKEGLDVEVIDVRTLSPLDFQTIADSVKKTGRVVVAQEAPQTLGFASEISARIMEDLILYLESPVIRVTGFDTTMPYHKLEEYYMPDVGRIMRGIRKSINF